jgi:hypothetical protein
MTIEDKVREIVGEYFSGFSFVFEDWNTADTKLDKVELPAIIMVLPVSGVLQFGQNGRIKDAENTIVAFVDKVPKEADGRDNEVVYNEMKVAARAFVRRLNESGYFNYIQGDVPYNTIIEQLSSIVTGVALQLQLKELVGRCE